VARELAEAPELSKFGGASFGDKALAALIAYREYALGRGAAFGVAARHWLEVSGSTRLLYYAPITAYNEAEHAKVEKPAAVEEMAVLDSVCVISPQRSGVVYSYYAASESYVLRRCCVSAAVSG
jgi:hypothetical protein